MLLTNNQLKLLYHGALWFEETKDGYLQAYQYTKEQMGYFKEASDFWYERCTASNAKTLEFTTAATSCSFDYKFLWMGDSITQGFGPLRSAHTYVSVANRLLDYEVLNQGIGGYIYDKHVLMPMLDYKPDKIIISMGTNQFGTESMEGIEEYYKLLKEIYGDTPVLCILPIWRGDVPDGLPILTKFCKNLKAIVEQYENITIVDGFTLVPHLPEYFLDNLHPNCLGSEMYGRNLVLAIERAGF